MRGYTGAQKGFSGEKDLRTGEQLGEQVDLPEEGSMCHVPACACACVYVRACVHVCARVCVREGTGADLVLMKVLEGTQCGYSIGVG